MKKLLVVIASYGQKNDRYLSHVLAEYKRMPFQTDIVVLSDLQKNLGPDVEVVVGLPTKNPMSLPFGHKQIFAERLRDYDLFMYSEDDMLITKKNIEAVLRVNRVLPPEELTGFFQFEEYPDGKKYFPAVHGHFHWLPESVKTVDGYTFAQFTNEHSACYLLTRDQLERVIASGRYLVQPHEGKYTMLETATTDPYTQCGFRKVMCISHFEEFLVAHLPNCYLDRLGLHEVDFYGQLDVLKSFADATSRPKCLLEPENRLFLRRWSKDLYEPSRDDLVFAFPTHARSVLSIGCGWGATEAALIKRGIRVTAIAVDSVIGTCAESRGVHVLYGDLEGAMSQVSNERFDGILLSGVLHLLQNPQKALCLASRLLAHDGTLVATFPNIARLPFLWRRLCRPLRYKGFTKFEVSGMHSIGRRRAVRWFREAGLKVSNCEETVPAKWEWAVMVTHGLAARLFSLEYTVVGRKQVN